VLVDGVSVRDWHLESLRQQISIIEQDIFLFSRTVAENIAFGCPGATQEQIEQAAKDAQAHDFIMGFTDGYQTVIGERGVTLSGGQRQRLALARAFLTNPRILILDDSTSAIDSATEDQIQRAIERAAEGRTTLLITHRLSQIRWADQPARRADGPPCHRRGTNRCNCSGRENPPCYMVETDKLDKTRGADLAGRNGRSVWANRFLDGDGRDAELPACWH